MTPEQTLDWLAQQHFDQCCEERPIQDWIRKMKSQLPEQPEQEPSSVTYKEVTDTMNALYAGDSKQVQIATALESKKLYTTPPTQQSCSQRPSRSDMTWVGLTDVEWMNIVNKDHAWFGQKPEDVAHEVAKAVEAKLKEKNT